MSGRPLRIAGWAAAIGLAVGVRLWNALSGPRMWGYDAWGHVAYVLFLDVYRAVPWADQGWSYFHPPLHYALGWGLAQFGSGEVLMRGLSLLGSAASLGTAGLAAWLVARTSPERPALALLAFAVVALLPAHLFMSPMPGNALTETFLSAAALSVFVANEARARPSALGAAAVGALLGLALLAKFSGALALAVAGTALGLRLALALARRSPSSPVLVRGALVVGVALVIATPYYARNWKAFGNPFQLSREFALVAAVERDQPPGSRTWRDYVRVSPKLFADADPQAPHLLHSVWGSLYVNFWADTHRESDVAPTVAVERRQRRLGALMAVLGFAPTALAALGALLALGDVWRGRLRSVYVPLLLLAGGGLAAFVGFTWSVPTYAALKPSYCLCLSLPFGVFAARGMEGLAGRGIAWLRVAAPAALALALVASSVVGMSGIALPRRADAPATGAVRFYFGEYEDARRIYGRLVRGAPYPVPWLENLAAVDLAEGRAERARRLYARAASVVRTRELGDPYRQGRLAAATALAGDPEQARRLLDRALAERTLPELLANRGAILALLGDVSGAERDLHAALGANPEMTPAWRNLAILLERVRRSEEAARARQRAAEAACRGPRRYPYGIGTGEILEWGIGRRWLLLLDDSALRAAPPAFYRGACAFLRREAPSPGAGDGAP